MIKNVYFCCAKWNSATKVHLSGISRYTRQSFRTSQHHYFDVIRTFSNDAGCTECTRMEFVNTVLSLATLRSSTTQWVHPEAQPLTERSVSSCIWLCIPLDLKILTNQMQELSAVCFWTQWLRSAA